MKNAVPCAILFLALPAFATIAPVQSKANWTCSGTTCAVSFTSNPITGNLIAVWTFWQSTGTFTASVQDSPTLNNTFYSAVGPTLQSAASTPTTGQIFYAKSINGGSADTVTVTFTGTGTISSAGAVIVEISDADHSNPLDSTAAAFSTSGNPTSQLDSGAVAPANANLLVFGAGTSDANILPSPGSGFTTLQRNSSPGSITEYIVISGNNTLRRANASESATSDWLMQMAVFRDASWTVTGGWTPIRVGRILDASQFPGSNTGAQINNAAAALPSTGGEIDVPLAGSTNSALNLGGSTQPVHLVVGSNSVLTCNLTTTVVPTTVTGISETGTTVTVTTSLNPGIGANNNVSIQGSSVPAYDGIWTVTSSNSSQFQFYDPISGLSSCSSSCGTASLAASCIAEGAVSRLSGDGIAEPAIIGSGSQSTTSMFSNTNFSEYFQFDDFQFKTGLGDTFSAAAMEIEGGFVPSYMDNVFGNCELGTGGVPCLHLTTGASSGDSGGDYAINQSWFECEFTSGCTPLSVNTPVSGNHLENIAIVESAIQHPGQGISDATIDGTTGGIFNLNFIDDRFEGSNKSADATTPLVSLNNVDSTNFLYPWFAPLCPSGCNPYAINVTGASNSNMLTVIGARIQTANGINNTVTGRTVNEPHNHLPLYIFAQDGDFGVIETDPFIFSSPGDYGLNLHFNSGATGSQITNVTWDDQNTAKWDWQKASDDSFQVLDVANNQSRLYFKTANVTTLNSGGTSAIILNGSANSGTGGVTFNSGGASPTEVAAVDHLGQVYQPGVAFASLPTPPAEGVGTMQFCTNCIPTTATSCSTATPASCVCKAGTGSMWAKYENFVNNGAGWYCH